MTQSDVRQIEAQKYHQRKDPRISFVKNQLLTAKCETIDSRFSASVQDLSSGGAFIYSKERLSIGQEIAMTIKLPASDEFLRVTGEIARISPDGYGVRFNIIFND
jgi:Tfp pilus assembly protein PilZ